MVIVKNIDWKQDHSETWAFLDGKNNYFALLSLFRTKIKTLKLSENQILKLLNAPFQFYWTETRMLKWISMKLMEVSGAAAVEAHVGDTIAAALVIMLWISGGTYYDQEHDQK